MKKQESGIAANLQSLRELSAFCNKQGDLYQPSKESLKLPALEAVLHDAEVALNNVHISNVAYRDAAYLRSGEIQKLQGLGTQLYNALLATDAGPGKRKEALGVLRKLRGQRVKAVKPPSPTEGSGGGVPEAPITISVSQRSFEEVLQHFDLFIEILRSEPSYQPNETELKVDSLGSLLEVLKGYHLAVAQTHAAVMASRNTRDHLFYDEHTGLVSVGSDCKKYLKSVLKASSIEYKMISGLLFKKKRQ